MVAGFVGADASLKQLTLTRVCQIKLKQCLTARETDSVDDLRTALAARKWKWALILDQRGRPLRWVSPGHLAHASTLRGVGNEIGEAVSIQSTLQDALEALLAESNASTVVTGRRGEYVGLITIDTLVSHLSEMREEHAHDHDDDESDAENVEGRI